MYQVMGADWTKPASKSEGYSALLPSVQQDSGPARKRTHPRAGLSTANQERASVSERVPMSCQPAMATNATTPFDAESIAAPPPFEAAPSSSRHEEESNRNCHTSAQTNDGSTARTANCSVADSSTSLQASMATPRQQQSKTGDSVSQEKEGAGMVLPKTVASVWAAGVGKASFGSHEERLHARVPVEVHKENMTGRGESDLRRNEGSLLSSASTMETRIGSAPGRAHGRQFNAANGAEDMRNHNPIMAKGANAGVSIPFAPERTEAFSTNCEGDNSNERAGREQSSSLTRRPKQGTPATSCQAAPSHPGALVAPELTKHSESATAKRVYPPSSGETFAPANHPGARLLVDAKKGGVRDSSGTVQAALVMAPPQAIPFRQKQPQQAERRVGHNEPRNQFNSQSVTVHQTFTSQQQGTIQRQNAANFPPRSNSQRANLSSGRTSQANTRGVQQQTVHHAQHPQLKSPWHQPVQHAVYRQPQHAPNFFPLHQQGAYAPAWRSAGNATTTTSTPFAGGHPYQSAQAPFVQTQRMNQPSSRGIGAVVPTPPPAVMAAFTAAEAALRKSASIEEREKDKASSVPSLSGFSTTAPANVVPIVSRGSSVQQPHASPLHAAQPSCSARHQSPLQSVEPSSNASTTQAPSKAPSDSAATADGRTMSQTHHPSGQSVTPSSAGGSGAVNRLIPVSLERAHDEPSDDSAHTTVRTAKPPPMLKPLNASRFSLQDLACIPLCFSYEVEGAANSPNPASLAEAQRKQDEWNRQISHAQISNGKNLKRKRPSENREDTTEKSRMRRLQAAEVKSGPAGKDLPPGWTYKVVQRMSGATKGTTDTYWYSPKTGKKFRSMAEIRRFLHALKNTDDDDEEVAWKTAKSNKGKEA